MIKVEAKAKPAELRSPADQFADWAELGMDSLLSVYAKCPVGQDELARRGMSEVTRLNHCSD
jgi:hypothetical protein